MRGHEPILAMRKRGIKPSIVFINDFACPESHDWQNPGEKFSQQWPADHATVSTAGDPLSSLDLRFLVGLTVSISSMNEGRAKALFENAKASGAATVAACHHIQAIHSGCKSGWTQIHHAQE